MLQAFMHGINETLKKENANFLHLEKSCATGRSGEEEA